MVGTQRLEHAALSVENLDTAVSFYTDVLGLAVDEVGTNRVTLTCGYDDRYDFVATESGAGVDHFALRAEPAAFERYVDSLKTSDVGVEPVHKDDTDFKNGARFTLPSGVDVELVVVADARYRRENETTASRGGVAPVDVDHITLMSDAIRDDVAFLEEHLDFNVSEIHKRDDGDWRFAWTRMGSQHHDVAFVNTDRSAWTLHHLAWTMTGIEHIKSLADRMAQHNYDIEVGVNRHVVGSNIFAYFQEPGGNRFELSAEMSTLDESTTTRVNEPGDDVLSAWGGVRPPESYDDGT